jgi:hypothetical protein
VSQAIINNGTTYDVYMGGKLIGTTKTHDEAWALIKKTKEQGGVK